jgi:glutathionylspermidine synthase
VSDQPDIHLGPSAWSPERYGALADDLLASCLVVEPWVGATPRFYGGPLVLGPGLWDRFREAARDIGALYDELARLVWEEPGWLDEFYAFSPWQRLLWLSSGGAWHGFARLDLFVCEGDQLQVCEINADTPTGQVDACTIAGLVAPQHPGLTDLMGEYPDRLWEMICQSWRAWTGREGQPRELGIVYPTDMPEDLTLMRLYTRWFEARGARVSMGSPYNLAPTPDGGAALWGRPLDVVLRHYKTDWWAEPRPVWLDEPELPDPDPLEGPLRVLLGAEQRRRLCVVNPFGAIVPQSKRSMAVFWERLDRFSPQAQATIQRLIPPTYRVETLGHERLLAERERWVLKSDFGCEGDEVVLGPACPDEVWARTLGLLTSGNWVAQAYFRASPLGGPLPPPLELGAVPNYGVYLIAGQPAGLLVRLTPQGEATGRAAVVTPAFLDATEPIP